MAEEKADVNPDGLTAYLLRCRTCWNRGTVERWACETCWHWYDFETRYPSEGADPPKQPILYTARELRRLPDPPRFPACSHFVILSQTLNAVPLDCECPKCQGSGTRTIFLPPAQATEREKRRQQRKENDRKKLLSGFGQKVPCGAKTRKPGRPPCEMSCIEGRAKCGYHGGLNIGPHPSDEARQWLADMKRKMPRRTPSSQKTHVARTKP